MAFTVSLNGNNYISDKRKTAFEKALEDDRKVKPGGNGQKPPVSEPQPLVRDSQANPVVNAVPLQPQTNQNYARMFESLESGLAQSYGHQSETLHVHQQYLHNQGEYTAIFSQLMQQQGALFANSATSPEQAEVALTVIKSLAKSIEQFHQHQTETLNVHNQFLNQQSQYAQDFVQLLRQQYSGSNGANGVIHQQQPGVVPTVFEMPVPSVPLYTERTQVVQPQPVVAPEVPTQDVTIVPFPVSTVQPAVKGNQPFSSSPALVTPPADSNALDNDSGAMTQMLLSIVSEKTGYPAEMLELDMDMEADLGIDSIKRVEIMGALQDSYPEMPDMDTEVLAGLRTLSQIINYVTQNEEKTVSDGDKHQTGTSGTDHLTPEMTYLKQSNTPDVQEMKTALLEIVSEKTGYPAEMLELDMDMEADLGIDSIKRVEILGALQDAYPAMPEIDADTLGGLRTLQQIIDYIDVREHAEKKV